MANPNMFIAPIYGIGRNPAVAGGVANAKYLGFPSSAIMVKPASQTFNGVTVNSVITLLPFGNVVNQIEYYTNKTCVEVVALANT